MIAVNIVRSPGAGEGVLVRMITEENLDSDSGRELHYVSENGRVEGLILESRGEARPRGAGGEARSRRQERPRSAKGRRGGGQQRDVNQQGVTELFSDILYSEEEEEESEEECWGGSETWRGEARLRGEDWGEEETQSLARGFTSERLPRSESSSPHKLHSAR